MKLDRLFSRWLVMTMIACGHCFGDVATNTLIIPKENETVFGDSSWDPLFSYSSTQQVYPASEFGELPSDVIVIREVAFRAENTHREIDAIISRLSLRMNVFPGSMEELVDRQDGLIPPLTRVFDQTNVVVKARTNLLDAFDIQFELNPPFVYDRKTGQLVLLFSRSSYSGQLAGLDAEFFRPAESPSYTRGVLIFNDDRPRVRSSVMVTRFVYSVGAVITITGVRKGDGYLEIMCVASGEVSSVAVESTKLVEGPYQADSSVVIDFTGNREFRAMVPLPSTNHFFRISYRIP